MVTDLALLQNIVEDGLFAAMAAVGFASISHTPRRTYAVCALAGATAHSLRYILTLSASGGLGLIAASTIAAFAAGLVSILFAPLVKVPAEACLFPSLLPMIPGIYAYKSFRALGVCLSTINDPTLFNAAASQLLSNGLTWGAIVTGMALGANMPVFLFKRISFQVTR